MLLAFFAVYVEPQVLSSRNAAQPGSTLPVLSLQDVISSQLQDFAFILVEFHYVPVGRFLQCVEVLLHGSPAHPDVESISWSPIYSHLQLAGFQHLFLIIGGGE